jgi:peptidoglycan/xylan/chitin deacetylase (PgdA/CDA1 family)
VIFTIDDGYEDCITAGLPVFREFDVPVTVFVVPGIIDAGSWFWWDQVEWLVARQQRSGLVLDAPEGPLPFAWLSDSDRDRVTQQLIELLKRRSPVEREAAIAQLAAGARESLERRPPQEYRVADWDTLRRAESELVRFGAHTMSHPILSGCRDDESQAEIQRSVERLREELRDPSHVFCYPNGTDQDFGAREEASAREAGAQGAVSTIPGFVQSATLGEGDRLLWRLPRVSFADSAGENMLTVLRVE